MFSCISPRRSGEVRQLITSLAQTAEHSVGPKHEALVGRYDHIYGDLSGQRALTIQDIEPYLNGQGDAVAFSKTSIILALEAYFAALCKTIAASAASGKPALYLRSLSGTDNPEFIRRFEEIISGRAHAAFGIGSFDNSNELEWHVDSACLLGVRHLIGRLAALWEGNGPLVTLPDPMQVIHDEIFPKNLTHVTGQFYTPPWLCQLLVNDLRPQLDSRFIDPFCGSGAFLLAALNFLKSQGVDQESSFKQILGIDLNPSACAAARTNLVLYAAKARTKDYSALAMNIVCADSLAPAVRAGSELSGDLFQANLSTANGRPHLAHAVIDGKRFSPIINRRIATENWIDGAFAENNSARSAELEQKLPFIIRKADVLLTNPPWVGWEYMSRPYRTKLNPAWGVYSLFEQKGLQASFLKEDLSTLCVVAACDRYLRNDGKGALVIRPAAMQSELAGRGLRRLSIFANSESLKLERVRVFEGLQVFGTAIAPAATWQLSKGGTTTFPVPVVRWNRTKPRWQPDATSTLDIVLANVEKSDATCQPVNPDDRSSRWAIGSPMTAGLQEKLGGVNNLQARIGFFTGGANSVYYMRPVRTDNSQVWTCENITDRAKRKTENVTVDLEVALLYRALRGRDIGFWYAKPEVFVICPHTQSTKMYPVQETELRESYKLTYRYLKSVETVLRQRNGFAGWEKNIHREYFYTLQRVGDYTFAPFKVCWSYISDSFEIAVVGPDESGKPVFPNDKVVFLPFYDEKEAYFTAGILSSSAMRLGVVSSISSRQVSTNVIKHYKIPPYDRRNRFHSDIADRCRGGHEAMKSGDLPQALSDYESVDHRVATLFGLSDNEMAAVRTALSEKLRHFPFRPN